MPTSSPPPPAGGHPPSLPAPPFSWLPIRALGERQRPRILAHLMALDPTDRYLRFGHAASDAHIARYVDQLDFQRDEIFGVHSRRLDLVALAHLAYLGHNEDQPTEVEFGVSVLPRLRGRRLGSRLFEHACLHARNRSIDTMVVHALTENRAMLKIALDAGARVERDGPDAVARLRLPPDDLGTQLSEIVSTRAGELDYRFKVQARRFDRWLGAFRHRLATR